MRLDQLVAQSLLRQRRGNRSGWRRHHRAHPLDERAAAGRQLHRLQIVLSVQNAIGQRLLLRQHRSITCSMLSSVTRLMTSTVRIWFFRQARAMRCSSFAGFHGRSRLITELAIWRLSPTLPLVRRKEQPTVRITLEARDLCAAAVLRHRSSKAWRQNNVFVVPPCGSPMASSRERAT